ncbi:hypothetical protein HanXRQr2_Chr07g0289381 [Helianthus annuus]|uniref:Uncharacterized protein n=1 Tax=Helianthus annuus TaxID=4232 RepID=A0A9K3IKB1_HELAN|nr:hypothetical protein HanXRQr2_Chr07g0289381 [Helianthus annuus]KAJ0549784.1 hypothetical protein HanHA300_Chr07g0237921 [Helianthus annuus]KAJ0556295.1 hypothetical protein HanIR_Chr07g0312151 [Helianthus annuus]KAJ0562738.1 hypothetical protein HanHA89_Chr07g0255091 [Helianthus annuus]KAJ0728114.1 hypothetical protein HanLR1_Chr07g0237861 [Helianthus annuus]
MVTNVSTSISERVVPERSVNVEELRTIRITQMLERLGWERVLDWCEDNTPRIYLAAVCEWLASLGFQNRDGPPENWKLVGNTGRGEMIMSFETMNCIARFDSLGVQAYDYPRMDHFFDNKTNEDDHVGIIESVLPYTDGGVAMKS